MSLLQSDRVQWEALTSQMCHEKSQLIRLQRNTRGTRSKQRGAMLSKEIPG